MTTLPLIRGEIVELKVALAQLLAHAKGVLVVGVVGHLRLVLAVHQRAMVHGEQKKTLEWKITSGGPITAGKNTAEKPKRFNQATNFEPTLLPEQTHT